MRKSRGVKFAVYFAALQFWPTISYSQSITLNNIAATFQALPLIPAQKYPGKNFVPGTPVVGLSSEVVRGVAVLRAQDFEACASHGLLKGFEVRAPAPSFTSEGSAELEDLRMFLGGPSGSMDRFDSVHVEFENVWSLYSPFAKENFAIAIKAPGCTTKINSSRAMMAVRVIFADINLTFSGRNFTSEQTNVFLSQGDRDAKKSDAGGALSITLMRRLVALKLDIPP